jgi:hypothetical protein
VPYRCAWASSPARARHRCLAALPCICLHRMPASHGARHRYATVPVHRIGPADPTDPIDPTDPVVWMDSM